MEVKPLDVQRESAILGYIRAVLEGKQDLKWLKAMFKHIEPREEELRKVFDRIREYSKDAEGLKRIDDLMQELL